MQKNDNHAAPQIYYRPLRKWIEVTPEEKKNRERFIGATRKAKQRAGVCCIPYKKSYKCDGLCEECEYRCIPKDAVQPLSIDTELEIVCDSGFRNTFLADTAMTTEISIDSMILNRLLSELRDSDPESYQILMALADGLSERAGAERLNMPRNTFVYKRNQLLKRIRKNF